MLVHFTILYVWICGINMNAFGEKPQGGNVTKKYLISADWHIKLWADRETTVENIPLRLHEIFSAIRQMCDYAMANGVSTVIVAGDINDKKNIIDVKAFVRLKKILEE